MCHLPRKKNFKICIVPLPLNGFKINPCNSCAPSSFFFYLLLLSYIHTPSGSWSHNLTLHLTLVSGRVASWTRACWLFYIKNKQNLFWHASQHQSYCTYVNEQQLSLACIQKLWCFFIIWTLNIAKQSIKCSGPIQELSDTDPTWPPFTFTCIFASQHNTQSLSMHVPLHACIKGALRENRENIRFQSVLNKVKGGNFEREWGGKANWVESIKKRSYANFILIYPIAKLQIWFFFLMCFFISLVKMGATWESSVQNQIEK